MDNLVKLLEIMQKLRDPEKGCPWDIAQTFESIVPYTLEEVYEVADAIDEQDFDQLKDELGDLLLQIVYYTQMAREKNLFNFEDVAESICDKLVRRHPHVFDLQNTGIDSRLKDKTELNKIWETIKQKERSVKLNSESMLNDIPLAMPQLLRAKKIQKRVANVGFDWKELLPVIEKIQEEFNELKDELNSSSTQENIEEELGDFLFSVVNLSRHLNVNAENALRKSNNKFVKRFQFIEAYVAKENKNIDECGIEELEKYWQLAKSELTN